VCDIFLCVKSNCVFNICVCVISVCEVYLCVNIHLVFFGVESPSLEWQSKTKDPVLSVISKPQTRGIKLVQRN